ncbi:hypothetical protein BOX15_Mlig026361g1, partial [Macrostomum lignano]
NQVNSNRCDLCGVTFTSAVHRSDHLSGRPHQRAVSRALHAEPAGEAFCCLICDVACNSEASLAAHCRGQAHQRRLKMPEALEYVRNSAEHVRQEDRGGGVVWYWCDLCNIHATSKSDLASHFQGRGHKNAVVRAGVGAPSLAFDASETSSSIVLPGNQQQQAASSTQPLVPNLEAAAAAAASNSIPNHSARIAVASLTDEFSLMSVHSGAQVSQSPLPSLQYASQTVQPANQTVQPASQTVQPANQTVQPASQTVQSATQPVQPASQPVPPVQQPQLHSEILASPWFHFESEGRYRCNLCGTFATSMSNLADHWNGRLHKNKARRAAATASHMSSSAASPSSSAASSSLSAVSPQSVPPQQRPADSVAPAAAGGGSQRQSAITSASTLGLNFDLNGKCASPINLATWGIDVSRLSSSATSSVGVSSTVARSHAAASLSTGFNASASPSAGFNAAASPSAVSPSAGFNTAASPSAGFNAAASPSAGFNTAGFDAAGFNAAASPSTGFNTAGFNAATSPSAGFNTAGFNTAGFNAAASPSAGFNTAGFNAAASPSAGFNAAGFNAAASPSAGFNAAGFNAAASPSAGFNPTASAGLPAAASAALSGSAVPHQAAGQAQPLVESQANGMLRCTVCNVQCNTPDQMLNHKQGKNHLKRLRVSGIAQPAAATDRAGPEPDLQAASYQPVVQLPDGYSLCNLCGIRLHGNNVAAHVAGRDHRRRLAVRCPAPDRQAPPCEFVANPRTDWPIQLRPRIYQLEAYRLCCRHGNALCVLPTGTGKTLVAALAILAALEANPLRSAVFLVDKVLLVLQQTAFLRAQLTQVRMRRFVRPLPPPSSPALPTPTVTRSLAVAAVCGDLHSLPDDQPLAAADLVVTTAAFYANCLRTGALRLDQACLLAMDEAHHCDALHPYSLLAGQVLSMPELESPRLLGFTASPAGQASLPATQKMLVGLLDRLGGARLAWPSSPDAQAQLAEFSVRAGISGRLVPPLTEETAAVAALINHSALVLTALRKAAEASGASDAALLVNQLLSNGGLDCPNLAGVLDEVAERTAGSQPVRLLVEQLLRLSELRSALSLAICEDSRVAELDDAVLSSLLSRELLAEMRQSAEALVDALQLLREGQAATAGAGSVLRALADDLRGTGGARLALVIVRERATARRLTDLLTSHSAFADFADLRPACLIGHGAAGDAGMSVAQQRRLLFSVARGEANALVATPIACEGLDLPRCDLLVLADPPSRVAALVQSRGRVRVDAGRCLVYCRSAEERQRLQDLLAGEANLLQAVRLLAAREGGGS